MATSAVTPAGASRQHGPGQRPRLAAEVVAAAGLGVEERRHEDPDPVHQRLPGGDRLGVPVLRRRAGPRRRDLARVGGPTPALLADEREEVRLLGVVGDEPGQVVERRVDPRLRLAERAEEVGIGRDQVLMESPLQVEQQPRRGGGPGDHPVLAGDPVEDRLQADDDAEGRRREEAEQERRQHDRPHDLPPDIDPGSHRGLSSGGVREPGRASRRGESDRADVAWSGNRSPLPPA